MPGMAPCLLLGEWEPIFNLSPPRLPAPPLPPPAPPGQRSCWGAGRPSLPALQAGTFLLADTHGHPRRALVPQDGRTNRTCNAQTRSRRQTPLPSLPAAAAGGRRRARSPSMLPTRGLALRCCDKSERSCSMGGICPLPQWGFCSCISLGSRVWGWGAVGERDGGGR